MTKIGIISDTHDNYTGTKKAVEIFRQKKVDFIMHLGDLISPPMVQCFKGMKTKLILGNNEAEIIFLLQKVKEFGIDFHRHLCEFEADGKRFVAFHGFPAEITEAFIKSGKYDYVLAGHFHKKLDKREGNVRIINPGSLFLGDEEHTIAILDVKNDELEFVRIN